MTIKRSIQRVYETNLDRTLTYERLKTSEAIGGLDYTRRDLLWFTLKGDNNIKEIQITPNGKVMIFYTCVEALNERLPLIKSLTLNKDGDEADWKLIRTVSSSVDILREIKSRLQNIKPRWTITAYNRIITKTGLRAELEIPELDYFTGRDMELSDEDKKILQIKGNFDLSEKLRLVAEEELTRTKTGARKRNSRKTTSDR
jgi:hypothetical protein